MPLTQWQKEKIARSGKITEAEASQLLNEFQTNKNTLKNPTGWLISALETKFGITFKNSL